MNKNIEYEKITQEIYQSLINEDGLTIDVQHDIQLQGKAFKHQIDVYWEYKVAGVINRVAIECKNYNRKISVGKIRDFYGVLSDVGNLSGIMVTKDGFQKGAIEFAEHYGINLIVLREPIEQDWDGRIKTIVTKVQAISHHVKKWDVVVDKDWIINNFPKQELKNFHFSITGKNDEIWITNSTNERQKSLLQLEDGLPYDGINTKDLNYFYEFDDGFIVNEKYGRLKIKGINFLYDIGIFETEFVMDAQKTVKAIVKDVLSGDIKFIR